MNIYISKLKQGNFILIFSEKCGIRDWRNGYGEITWVDLPSKQSVCYLDPYRLPRQSF